ncbi:hypothetical protein [Streptomyces sp. NPDC001307]|uniref:hypothetical protein n=1 Tax=Streptomyces sp. NPDC001307 TaxID=3364560 RepID=UPI003685379E
MSSHWADTRRTTPSPSRLAAATARGRRRQALTVTDRGHDLPAARTAEARALDAELTAHPGESERQALHTAPAHPFA